MSFKKEGFTIIIGNDGSIVSLNKDKSVISKVFLASLTKENKDALIKMFNKRKSAPIYIMIDNSEQNYSNKSYPPLNSFDLKKIIARNEKKEAQIANQTNVLTRHIVNKNKVTNKWDCVHISLPYNKEIEGWVNFLLQDVNNPIAGIYMLPVEAVSLAQKISVTYNTKNKKSKVKQSDKVVILIVQSKVSGIRQVVFSKERIVFTRLIKYDYEDPSFVKNFEQDIFRTGEYLKRILPALGTKDIEIINILPRSILEKIDKLTVDSDQFSNYTPREAAIKIGYKDILPKNSQFTDILLANVFFNSKKSLRFSNKGIRNLSIFGLINQSFVFINSIMLLGLILFILFIRVEQSNNDEKIKNINIEKNTVEEQLQEIKAKAIGNKNNSQDNVNINKIIEFGQFDEALEDNKIEPMSLYNKLDFIARNNATVSKVDFSNSFVLRNKRSSDDFELSVEGDINNNSGDVDDLFEIYDKLMLDAKNSFEGFTIESSELPQNIDFSKKYYSVPFSLKIKTR